MNVLLTRKFDLCVNAHGFSHLIHYILLHIVTWLTVETMPNPWKNLAMTRKMVFPPDPAVKKKLRANVAYRTIRVSLRPMITAITPPMMDPKTWPKFAIPAVEYVAVFQ